MNKSEYAKTVVEDAAAMCEHQAVLCSNGHNPEVALENREEFAAIWQRLAAKILSLLP